VWTLTKSSSVPLELVCRLAGATFRMDLTAARRDLAIDQSEQHLRVVAFQHDDVGVGLLQRVKQITDSAENWSAVDKVVQRNNAKQCLSNTRVPLHVALIKQAVLFGEAAVAILNGVITLA
jgi:hypothetical protein